MSNIKQLKSSKAVKPVRKIAVAAIGFPVLLVGLILIPLPGPGLVLCYIGLFILSLEFDQVKKPLDKARSKLKDIYVAAKQRADKVENWGNKGKDV